VNRNWLSAYIIASCLCGQVMFKVCRSISVHELYKLNAKWEAVTLSFACLVREISEVNSTKLHT
jgi:hypothetical protein